MPKQSKSSFIRFNKKFSNPELIAVVNEVAKEKMMSPADVCYLWVQEAAQLERDKREMRKKRLNNRTTS
jgi:hypothetical protein